MYRVRAIPVEVHQPGSSKALSFGAPTRNLGAGGVALIHGGYLHVGSTVQFQLPDLDGTWIAHTGEITACRHVEHYIHEVAVKFDDEIDPAHYSAAASTSRLLIVSGRTSVHEALGPPLEALNATVTRASYNAEGVKAVVEGDHDCVILDDHPAGKASLDLVKAARATGQRSFIMVMLNAQTIETEHRCLVAGCNDVFEMPTSSRAYEWILARPRQKRLFSAFHQDPELAEKLTGFCDAMPGAIRVLRVLVRTLDTEGIARWAVELHRVATTLGYAELASQLKLLERETTAEPASRRLAKVADATIASAKRIEPGQPRSA